MRKFIYENEYEKQIEFSSSSKYHLTTIIGLSENDVDLDESSQSDQVGTSVLSQHVNSKTLTLEGDFEFSRKARENLIRIISPLSAGKLRILDNDIDIYLDVIPTKTPVISHDTTYQKFQFVLKAPFPYWRSNNKSAISFTLHESKFKFPRSFSNTYPWKVSFKIQNVIKNIINESTVSTGFTVVFKAVTDVIAPELLNILTQERIKFRDDFILPAKDEIIVHSYYDKKIVIWKQNGLEKNAFRYLDDATTFFTLAPGDNIIRYGALENYEGLEVLLTYETTLIGI